MKTHIQNMPTLARFVVLALLSTLNPQLSTFAQGTAFTYQGRLTENDAPANGSNDFTFTLYNAASDGLTVGTSNVVSDLPVSNGLFTATLDFTASAFTNVCWLQIAVRPGASAGAYTNLIPRQPITSTPYAIRALNAGTAASATTASSVAAGAVTSSGLAVGAVGATAIADGSITSADLNPSLLNNTFWKLAGNDVVPGQFVGSTNDQSVEFRVANSPAFRLELDPRGANAANIIGGYNGNRIEQPGTGGGAIGGGGFPGADNIIRSNSSGAFIGAGSANVVGPSANDAVIGGGIGNTVESGASFAIIGGGAGNTNGSSHSIIAGGVNNWIQTNATLSSIGGGWLNTIQNGADQSVIAGGNAGLIQAGARESFIGGGFANAIQTNARASTIGGGTGNTIQPSAALATIGGGISNTNGGWRATIGGGQANLIQFAADRSTIGGGGNNTIVGSETLVVYGTIAGGSQNTIQTNTSYATIGGGRLNLVQSNNFSATIAGGEKNGIDVNASFSSIGGGLLNSSAAEYATVSGGQQNIIQTNAAYATIPGGFHNNAAGIYSFAAGRQAKANHQGAFVWADSQDADFASTASNQFLIRAAGNVGINKANPATALDVNGIVTATSFSGSGAGVTSLNVSNLTGTLADARLSTNVALRGGGNAFTGNQTVAGSLVVDQNSQNNGNVSSNSLTFGSASGEGIASKRTGEGNQWGLDFYTAFQNRMTILNSGNVGIGTTQPSARLSLVAPGASEVTGSARSATLLTSAGDLGTVAGDELALATIGFRSANSSSLGIRALRVAAGSGWPDTAIGLGMDVDDTVRAGASLWLHANGNIGIGTANPTAKLEVNGTVTAGGFSGNGAGLTNITVSGVSSSSYWNTSGNVGTTGAQFLGTTDNQPLDFRVYNQRGLRLEPGGSNSVNVIGGWSGNGVAPGVVGAIVAGGGAGDYFGLAYTNRVEGDFGTVSGGGNNTIETGSPFGARFATIGGGVENTIEAGGFYPTICGGGGNTIEFLGDYVTIGGGWNNKIQVAANGATIGGGDGNKIQPHAENATIGGGGGNTIQYDALYATIGGGKGNKIQNSATSSTIGGGHGNTIETGGPGDYSATIGGGDHNTIQPSAYKATIGGGEENQIGTIANGATIGGGGQNMIQPNADYATIGAGRQNTIQTNAFNATIGGGGGNTISNSAEFATIGGGEGNTTQPYALYATIPGGAGNSASDFAFAAGRRAKANHTGAFVWADSTDADFPSTGDNQFLIRAAGGVGINKTNPASALDVNGTVTATRFNGDGAGLTNITLSGTTSSTYWNTTGNAGANPTNGNFIGTTDSQALELKVNGTRALRLEPTISGEPNVIGGAPNNVVEAGVAGATIGGGRGNHANHAVPNIGGDFSTIGGGENNITSGDNATVGGGFGNISHGSSATVPGGLYNSADGSLSFAAGCRSKANHSGAFVWADSTTFLGGDFTSTANNQFLIRAAGGVGINKNNPATALDVNGTITASSATAEPFEARGASAGYALLDRSLGAAGRWSMYANTGVLRFFGGGADRMTLTSGELRVNGVFVSNSDRNVKAGFERIEAKAILEKVAALPITRWHYTNDPATTHLGPMAQDFQAAFAVGHDDKGIATVDADGVALAAIQGLNQKVEGEVTALRAENAELKQRMEKLEHLMNHKNGGAR